MKNKPTVIIVDPIGDFLLNHVHCLRKLFQADGWDVVKIEPDRKYYSDKAVVLVPDTGGLNTTVQYFISDAATPALAGQDNAIEYFRLNMLQWYVKKNMPILGIGTSAYLIFAELLRGKIMWGMDGLSYGHTSTEILQLENGILTPKTGCWTGPVDEDLCLFARTLLPKNPPLVTADILV